MSFVIFFLNDFVLDNSHHHFVIKKHKQISYNNSYQSSNNDNIQSIYYNRNPYLNN